MSGNFGWDYPPGETGAAHETTFELRCANEACEEFDRVYEVSGYNELGGGFLDDESEADCLACGTERMDA